LEKERFLDLARNFTSLTKEETDDLDALQKEFPYSQVIHNLASRGAQDNGLETSRKLLNISAVYSTDRSVLKDIHTSPRTTRASNDDQQSERPVVIHDQPVVENIAVPTSHSDGAIADEVLHDLERLKELKHDFEISLEAFQHPQPAKPASQKKKADPLAVVPEPVGEVLLEEIKTTKKKINPETPKQKEQIEIIDQFIKKAPSIRKNASNADSSDLAEKNFSLTENVVSETLVEILLRQGKKDKAIEVLKKLIWKFPQKKAIFAAQIDELKK
jgi:hypothetical protein